jgi:cellulose synthase/poly-beta-1,6-N-acetylglucosamine synthase-like glycosyltransferase
LKTVIFKNRWDDP